MRYCALCILSLSVCLPTPTPPSPPPTTAANTTSVKSGSGNPVRGMIHCWLCICVLFSACLCNKAVGVKRVNEKQLVYRSALVVFDKLIQSHTGFTLVGITALIHFQP